MKFQKLFVCVLACVGWAPAQDDRILLIPSHAERILQGIPVGEVLAIRGDQAIVKLGLSAVETLSEHVHHTFGACGGFIDVTGESQGGLSPEDLLDVEELIAQRMSASPPQYFDVAFDEGVEELVDKVSADRIWDFIAQMSAFPDRAARTDDGTRASTFMAQTAQEVGGHLPGFSVRTVATPPYPKQASVIATLPGKDPTLPAVVIGGHMDTLANSMPGADDDASGSAVVMEALRVIADQSAEFKRTIHFIWYAAEEAGLVGSKYVVRDFLDNNVAIAAALQFDMVGYTVAGQKDIYIIDDYTNAGLNQTVVDLIGTYLPEATIGHTSCGYACSDHASWHRNGIPATFPFEASFSHFNQAIHSSRDRLQLLFKNHALLFAKTAMAFLGTVGELEMKSGVSH